MQDSEHSNEFLNQHNTHKLLVVIKQLWQLAVVSTLGLLTIVSCKPYDNANVKNSIIESETVAKTAQSKADIEDRIVNSYARLASKQSHICPKLIQRQVDNTVIERSAEVMINNSCDYFLYPRVGEHIAVSLNSDQLEALLITPETYNFANGSYKVTSYDKHVIRLAYDGANHKPESFNYDIVVTIAE